PGELVSVLAERQSPPPYRGQSQAQADRKLRVQQRCLRRGGLRLWVSDRKHYFRRSGARPRSIAITPEAKLAEQVFESTRPGHLLKLGDSSCFHPPAVIF